MTPFFSAIFDAITQIEAYLARVSYHRFIASRLLQDGVMHEIEIIQARLP
jgi:uncharacterized protein with HEPN domain